MRNNFITYLFIFIPFLLSASNTEMEKDSIKKNRERIIAPMYRYIHSGMSLIGGIFTNQMTNQNNYLRNRVNYIGEIYYSNLNRVYGLGALSYRVGKEEKSKAWEPWLGYKRMPFRDKSDTQGPQEYNKLTLGVRYYLNTDFCEDSYLSLSRIFLNESFYIYQATGLSTKINLPTGITRLSFTKKNVFDASYGYIFESTIDNTRYKTPLKEYKNFTRLEAEVTQFWAVSNKKNLSVRIYGGAFLQNDNSNSIGGANPLVKGTLSLISQGFSDYAFDNNFMNRTSNENFTSHQLYDNFGGGFKNAPTNGNIVGLSNKYVASMNSKLDIFTSKFILGKIYGDIGIYESGNTKFIYSAGLQLGILKRVKLFIPLFQSKEISQTYRDNKLNFFERVTFSLDFKHHFTQRI